MILLVEDNEDDEALTLRAFKRNKVLNQVVVVRTGEEALDFLFATGPHAARDPSTIPTLMLLDLNLPKVNGLDVLRRVRSDGRTQRLCVVALTSSKQDEGTLRSEPGPTGSIRKPINFTDLDEAVRALGLAWHQLHNGTRLQRP